MAISQENLWFRNRIESVIRRERHGQGWIAIMCCTRDRIFTNPNITAISKNFVYKRSLNLDSAVRIYHLLCVTLVLYPVLDSHTCVSNYLCNTLVTSYWWSFQIIFIVKVGILKSSWWCLQIISSLRLLASRVTRGTSTLLSWLRLLASRVAGDTSKSFSSLRLLASRVTLDTSKLFLLLKLVASLKFFLFTIFPIFLGSFDSLFDSLCKNVKKSNFHL